MFAEPIYFVLLLFGTVEACLWKIVQNFALYYVREKLSWIYFEMESAVAKYTLWIYPQNKVEINYLDMRVIQFKSILGIWIQCASKLSTRFERFASIHSQNRKYEEETFVNQNLFLWEKKICLFSFNAIEQHFWSLILLVAQEGITFSFSCFLHHASHWEELCYYFSKPSCLIFTIGQ